MSQQILEMIQARKVAAEELMMIDDHLSACPACRELIGGAFAATASADRFERALAGQTDHLTFEELEAYVDRNLSADDVARVEDHVSICDPCDKQLRDLESFADVVPDAGVPSAGWLSSLGSILRPIPALAAVVVLVAIGAVIWFSRSQSEVAAVVETTPAPEPQPSVTIIEPTQPDAEVPPPANSQPEELAVSISDGGEIIGISREGRLSGYTSVGPQYRAMIKNVLTTGKAQVPDLRELSASSGVLMGDTAPGPTFRVTSPVGTVVNTDAPTFRWQAVPRASTYVVEVFDQDFNKVTSSGELKNPSWKGKLPRGKIYSWQVTATRDGEVLKAPQRPQPEARFRILDRKTADELSTLRRNNPKSHLALGVAYANAGLIDDAIREFEILSKQNPGNEFPKKLLRQLRGAR